MGGAIYGPAFVLTRNVWLPIGLLFGRAGPLSAFPLAVWKPAACSTCTISARSGLPATHTGRKGGLIGILSRFVVVALLPVWMGSKLRAHVAATKALATAD
jgi:hypothetical protein